MTTYHDDDFRQFEGTFDRAIDPDLNFTLRLQRQMAAQARPATKAQTVVQAAPTPAVRRPAVPVPPRRSPWMVAVAVMLVVAISASSVWVLLDSARTDQVGGPSRVTLPASADMTPAADTTLTPQILVPRSDAYDYRDLMDSNGDILLIGSWHYDGEGTPRLILSGIDQGSGETRWEFEAPDGLYQFASDTVVVGLVPEWNQAALDDGIDSAADSPTYRLTALETTTGDMLWSSPITGTNAQSSESWWSDPVIIDERIVLTSTFEAQAYDLTSGELVWSYDYAAEEMQISANGGQPAMVAQGDTVVLVTAAGDVRVLNAADGDVVASHDLGFTYSATYDPPITAQAIPQGIALSTYGLDDSGQNPELLAIDPLSGDVLWRRNTPENVSFAPSGDSTEEIVVFDMYWDEPNLFQWLLGTGTDTNVDVTWIDSATGETVLESSSELNSANAFTVTADQGVVCITFEDMECFDRAGTRLSIPIDLTAVDMMVVDGRLYTLMSDGSIWTVDLP